MANQQEKLSLSIYSIAWSLAWMRSEVKVSKACNCLTGLSIRQVTVLSAQERP